MSSCFCNFTVYELKKRGELASQTICTVNIFVPKTAILKVLPIRIIGGFSSVFLQKCLQYFRIFSKLQVEQMRVELSEDNHAQFLAVY